MPQAILVLAFLYRSEIHSGTVVTYNDRQEILCQKCTDIALHEDPDDLLPPSSSGNLTDGRSSLTDGRDSGSNSRSEDRHVRHCSCALLKCPAICEWICERGPYHTKTKLKLVLKTPVRVNPVQKNIFIV